MGLLSKIFPVVTRGEIAAGTIGNNRFFRSQLSPGRTIVNFKMLLFDPTIPFITYDTSFDLNSQITIINISHTSNFSVLLLLGTNCEVFKQCSTLFAGFRRFLRNGVAPDGEVLFRT